MQGISLVPSRSVLAIEQGTSPVSISVGDWCKLAVHGEIVPLLALVFSIFGCAAAISGQANQSVGVVVELLLCFRARQSLLVLIKLSLIRGKLIASVGAVV